MDLLQYALTGLAVAAFIGLAIGYFGKSRAEAVISLQAEENKALQAQNSRLKEENQFLTAENTTLKKNNKDLKELAQQTPEVRSLTSQIATLAISVANIAEHLGLSNAKK